MMKTLKYIVLLTVMLVNVTPYIKDGKVEWKTTQAAAQYYTIENTRLGFWICGSYDDPDIILLSRIQCNLLLPSQVSDEEPEFEDCFCGVCNTQKEYCQEPCTVCSGTSTVDAYGNDYLTGENICKCLCGAILGSCSEIYCSNSQCPYASSGGSTSQTRIRLSSHDSHLELGDRYNLEVEIEGYSVNSVTFLVDGLELQKGTSTTCNLYPTKPGTFNIKVMVNDNPNLVSNTEKVEVIFPPEWEIQKDNYIKSAMDNALKATKDAFNPGKVMKEYGFWIYLETSIIECKYSAGQMIEGNNAYCNDTPSVNMAPRPADNVPTSPKDNGKYVVAMFHTHPPILNCNPPKVKYVGPSIPDIEIANSVKIPCFVYDHEGTSTTPHDYDDNSLSNYTIYDYGLTRRE